MMARRFGSTCLRAVGGFALFGCAVLVGGAVLVSGPAAAPTPPSRRDPPPSEMPTPASAQSAVDDSAAIKAARAEAEEQYAKGYAIAQEGKTLLKAGKAGDAKKKFSKALKQFQSAVERDPAYYQAWNMVGYCSRHTGDLKKAFTAYQKCLAIAPDYEEAHEYLGEAYLQSGDIANAKIQLAWLRARDSEEADELAEAIEKVAPSAKAAAVDTSTSAVRDSARAQ